MKYLGTFFLPLMFVVSSLATAASSNRQPLFFQADKNNLQVLPQRFEYALVDEDRIKIGDIMIDSRNLTFQLAALGKDQYIMRFNWPAGLLREGQIIVKNNDGKALFTAPITKARTKVKKSSEKNGDSEEDTRSDSAEYITKVNGSLIEDMKYLPFMNFCIFREEANTRIYLCSKELYLSQKEGHIVVKSRNSTKQKALVEINAQTVGNQGIIYLNNAKENLDFKAFSQNGALLEIETRRNDVDFKDAVTSENGEDLLLTASGAEPVNEAKVKKIHADEWQTKIPLKRALVYLKGDGDIPMRQEFNVKGPLPTEKDRSFIDADELTRTYSSSLNFKVYLPEDSTGTALDNDSQLTAEGGFWRWNVNHIPSNVPTRRYLSVKHGSQNVVASHDFFRGLPFEFGASLKYSVPSGIAFADAHLSWWLENFLGLSSSATTLHWGLNADLQEHLISKNTEPKVDLTTFELLYRFTPGFYMTDETWGLLLPVQMLKTTGASKTLLGLGIFAQEKAPESWVRIMSWYQAKLRYFSGSSGTDFKVKQAYDLGVTAYKPFSDLWFLTYGVGLNQYKYDPQAGKEAVQLTGELGLAYHF